MVQGEKSIVSKFDIFGMLLVSKNKNYFEIIFFVLFFQTGPIAWIIMSVH